MATSPTCSIDGCGKPVNARGWCSMHLSRWQRHGEVGSASSTYNPGAACSECDRPARSNGLCGMHYQRLRKHGRTENPRPTLLQRLEAKYVEDPSGCWLWTAATGNAGYGVMRVGGRDDGVMRPAHAVSYELHRGPVPAGMELDHLCVTPACVNPDHLEPVTHRENMLRGPTNVGGRNARKTHCPQGHPYNEENTLWRGNGNRVCRECNRVRSLAASRRRAAVKRAV